MFGHFNNLIKEGSAYKKGNGDHKKAYKLDDYDILDNNCCTAAGKGLSVIGENWLGNEYDPRDALKDLGKNYKSLGLKRTVYKKGA